MAAPPGQLRTGRYFAALLATFAVLYALVFLVGSENTPRLGLDLIGGTTVTLQAETADGQPPTAESLELARQIIERRVNGLGVAEAEVVTEGDTNIVISVPGDDGEQAKQLGQTAQLRLRPLVTQPLPAGQVPTTETAVPTGSGVPTGSAAPTGTGASAGPGTSTESAASFAPGDPTTTDTSAPGSAAPGSSAPGSSAPGTSAPATTGAPGSGGGGVPTTLEEAQAQLGTLDCSRQEVGAPPEQPESYVAACSTDGSTKYLLAPAIIEGTNVDDANATFDTQGLQGWIVLLDFDGGAQSTWAQYTSEHNVTVTPSDPANLVAFTLDGQVISAPEIQGTIQGQTSITGSFSEDTARDLANSLKYGSLPLTFSQGNAETVSAELGIEQLRAGLIAGGIGVVLVFVYTMLYYRLLGLVTIASLLLSGALVYAVLVILGRQIGFTLTLAGIAGFIVAIGITADSFVVFFERLKDEVQEGRSMRSAVPRAWVRARRTILSADAVSFLAAAILYFLAIGAVKGFAFTLGLSTLLDLVIVFLFTHPLVSVLARKKGFSSPRFSGLGQLTAAAPVEEPTSGARERAAARRRASATASTGNEA
ncbi:MAG: protein translocase subunit SecD [Geodermatophilaceae bacterium]